MIIRELQCEDLSRYQDIIMGLLIDTYAINFQLPREQCKSICEEKMDLLSGYIENGKAIVIGAIDNDRLVGFVWLYIHNFFGEPRLHVNQIAVHHQSRGKGIGKQLMEEADKQARIAGIHTIDLFVSDINSEAVNMYYNLGFVTERRYLKKKV